MSKPRKIKFKIVTCDFNTIILKRSCIAQRIDRFYLSQTK